MEFESGHLYHIYNRGNNSQKIFFTHANYLFFLNKIKTNILPYADILAWCLMPSHFHLMIHIKEATELVTSGHLLSKFRGSSTEQETEKSQQFRRSSTEQVTENSPQLRYQKLNVSIGNMLSSYTRAIQIQENRTGSLFQHRTKARCLTRMEGISPAWFQTAFGVLINVDDPEKTYPQICFNYIHQNPVNDGLVKVPEDWEFSSAREYTGLRNGKMINKERTSEFGLIYWAGN
jgi:putative transposase